MLWASPPRGAMASQEAFRTPSRTPDASRRGSFAGQEAVQQQTEGRISTELSMVASQALQELQTKELSETMRSDMASTVVNLKAYYHKELEMVQKQNGELQSKNSNLEKRIITMEREHAIQSMTVKGMVETMNELKHQLKSLAREPTNPASHGVGDKQDSLQNQESATVTFDQRCYRPVRLSETQKPHLLHQQQTETIIESSFSADDSNNVPPVPDTTCPGKRSTGKRARRSQTKTTTSAQPQKRKAEEVTSRRQNKVRRRAAMRTEDFRQVTEESDHEVIISDSIPDAQPRASFVYGPTTRSRSAASKRIVPMSSFAQEESANEGEMLDGIESDFIPETEEEEESEGEPDEQEKNHDEQDNAASSELSSPPPSPTLSTSSPAVVAKTPTSPTKEPRYAVPRNGMQYASGPPGRRFMFCRTPRNVSLIWKEWKVGTNGNPPIEALEHEYGTAWRHGTTREIKFGSNYVKTREMVIKKVEEMVEVEGISPEEACSRLDRRVDGRIQKLIGALRKGQDPFTVIPDRT